MTPVQYRTVTLPTTSVLPVQALQQQMGNGVTPGVCIFGEDARRSNVFFCESRSEHSWFFCQRSKCDITLSSPGRGSHYLPVVFNAVDRGVYLRTAAAAG